jgi:protocatechuate 3,4-dioxygenase beta subunit
MAVYSIGDFGRRDILKMTAVIAAAAAGATSKIGVAGEPLARTPQQILGPFYPLKPLPKTADLTQVPGRPRAGARAGA